MILISPYSKQLRSGKINAKNYPWWPELIELLKLYDSKIIQIGVSGESPMLSDFKVNLPLKEILAMINLCDFWVSVDNFCQHLANKVGKRGVVIWSQSCPLIFGYKRNINILKDLKYLRKGGDQFKTWEETAYDEESFVKPKIILERLKIEGLLK